MKTNHFYFRSGFGLVETMVVVSLIIILTGVVAIRALSWKDFNEEKSGLSSLDTLAKSCEILESNMTGFPVRGFLRLKTAGLDISNGITLDELFDIEVGGKHLAAEMNSYLMSVKMSDIEAFGEKPRAYEHSSGCIAIGFYDAGTSDARTTQDGRRMEILVF